MAARSPANDLPTLAFASRQEWWDWLAEHHEDAPGLWLAIAKKSAGVPTVTYPEAVEVALCFGWIDGQKKSIDASYFGQRFSPRRPRSIWSKVNVTKATQLIEQGLMQPAGLRQVEAARADGRWDAAYEGARTSEVPDDLAAALADNPAAAATFAQLDGANRYAILFRLHTAKRAETRARRLAQFVTMLTEGRGAHSRP